MQVHELVARFAAAVETADPMGAARKVLEDLRGEIDHIEKMLAYISGIGGNARQVFYRSPNLTMLKVCFPNGRRTPPHDHGTWATILLLSGEEKNTMYRRENGRLRRVGEVTLTRGEILSHACRYRTCRRVPRRQTYDWPTCVWRRHHGGGAATHVGSPNTRGTRARLEQVRELRAGRIASALGSIAGRNVRYWHKADIRLCAADVRLRE